MPETDLAFLETKDLLDELGRRFDGAVLVTTKDTTDDGGFLGIWVSDDFPHSHAIGLLAWAQKLALDNHPCIGAGHSGGLSGVPPE